MAAWKTLSTEWVYETAWLKVRRDKVMNHNNQELTYSVVELHHPSVTIIAMDDEGRLLLQRNYRYPLNKTLWEFPAGMSDGENLLVAAKRELLEETGFTSDDWTSLGNVCVAVGIANIQSEIFLARDVQYMSDKRDKDEQISDQQFMKTSEIEDLALDGQLVDGSTLAALYRLKLQEDRALNV